MSLKRNRHHSAGDDLPAVAREPFLVRLRRWASAGMLMLLVGGLAIPGGGIALDPDGQPDAGIVGVARTGDSASVDGPASTAVATLDPTAVPDPIGAPGATSPPLAPTTSSAAPTATPRPAQAPTPSPAQAPTPRPAQAPTPSPAQAPTAAPTATPKPTATPAPASSSVRVTSIPALLSALADNAVTDIVVANGTYRVSAAGRQASNSLWIGARFAGRTRAVTVRAETRGGVTFDGGGATTFGGLSFEEGAHDQTWDGFNFANGQATETGIVTFGGYDSAGPYRITMRHITIERTCTGRATTASGPTTDHAFYISQALGTGPHDLLFEDISVDGRGGLASAFHFYHHDATHPNASNVTVRRLTVNGTQQAIIVWDSTLRGITFDTVTVTNALSFAVRHEAPGATGITYAHITSTGSGEQGFYSSQGTKPPGVTFIGNSFH